MQSQFLTPKDLASRWSIANKTLSQWRWNGHGPKYSKIGKLVRYSLEDIEAYEVSALHTITSPEIKLPDTPE
jgi:hypothetical protein